MRTVQAHPIVDLFFVGTQPSPSELHLAVSEAVFGGDGPPADGPLLLPPPLACARSTGGGCSPPSKAHPRTAAEWTAPEPGQAGLQHSAFGMDLVCGRLASTSRAFGADPLQVPTLGGSIHPRRRHGTNGRGFHRAPLRVALCGAPTRVPPTIRQHRPSLIQTTQHERHVALPCQLRRLVIPMNARNMAFAISLQGAQLSYEALACGISTSSANAHRKRPRQRD